MKKLFVFFTVFCLTILSCTDKKKKTDKQVEEAVKKIDSIEADVKKDIETLEKTTKNVEEDLKELDTI